MGTRDRIKLHKSNGFGTLEGMKRWQWLLLIVALLAVGWYFYYYRGSLRHEATPSSSASEGASSDLAGYQPARINWQTVDRRPDGFKLEMPENPKTLQVPAYNQLGSSEPIEMLYSSPDSATTFAPTWQDNPPVARANDHAPDKTLEAARDGMMERTQTALVSQSQLTVAGFPALDLTAKNSQGGILDARLIFVHDRLYTLIAAFPSADARREQDVVRFYNSFTPQLVNPGNATGGTS